MKNLRIPVGLLALALGLGACGETPLLAPSGPSYDSGPTFGTGHRADSTSLITTSTSSTEDGNSTTRNGSTFGTGH